MIAICIIATLPVMVLIHIWQASRHPKFDPIELISENLMKINDQQDLLTLFEEFDQAKVGIFSALVKQFRAVVLK